MSLDRLWCSYFTDIWVGMQHFLKNLRCASTIGLCIQLRHLIKPNMSSFFCYLLIQWEAQFIPVPFEKVAQKVSNSYMHFHDIYFRLKNRGSHSLALKQSVKILLVPLNRLRILLFDSKSVIWCSRVSVSLFLFRHMRPKLLLSLNHVLVTSL